MEGLVRFVCIARHIDILRQLTILANDLCILFWLNIRVALVRLLRVSDTCEAKT